MKWISVKDHLPEFDKEVLLWDDWKTREGETFQDCRVGYLKEVRTTKTSEGIQNYAEWGGTEFAFNITHWMPLPKPPNQS